MRCLVEYEREFPDEQSARQAPLPWVSGVCFNGVMNGQDKELAPYYACFPGSAILQVDQS